MYKNDKDVSISDRNIPFYYDLHVAYLGSFYHEDEDKFDCYNHYRLNAICWNITSLYLLKHEELINKPRVIEFLKSCVNEDGGYGPYPDYGSNIHSTLCAIQILVMLDSLSFLNYESVTTYITSLQQSDGCFIFDKFGKDFIPTNTFFKEPWRPY
ncbi:hypothetical protein HZS_1533, partial [Henneguya salminicola]